MKKYIMGQFEYLVYITAILVLSTQSCAPKVNTPESLSKGDNSMVSLDWTGTYTGILPCADCQGIETWITLNKDNTYLIKSKYIGKGDDFIENRGIFLWKNNGSNISLDGIVNAPNMYQVGENKLIQLDLTGQKITGNLAEKYQLKKVQ
jgi:copper homeostasis protein (lipoprotein)